MQIVIDLSRAGLTAAFQRFGLHALIVAAIAGATDLYASLKDVTISHQTAYASIGLALLASGIQNLLHWLAARKAASEAVVVAEFSGDIPPVVS